MQEKSSLKLFKNYKEIKDLKFWIMYFIKISQANAKCYFFQWQGIWPARTWSGTAPATASTASALLRKYAHVLAPHLQT